ncbi:cell division protein ZapE [Aliivibrio kagoshimensis]|uniref:cell division protein ZapE n=1 Tax=Aliivibrio kagoshimensis TaxID=2910230 RepID=UPI003D0F044A
MTPIEKYQIDLTTNDFQYDAAQEHAVQCLNDLYLRVEQLQTSPLSGSTAPSQGLLSRLFKKKTATTTVEPLQGLYFWGGVGRGKTYLVDTFYESLTSDRKMRVHFHRFMQRVHDELTALEYQSDPLLLVADKFKSEADIICFDEFFVSDITDAMILGTLFEALFARGITLVATSNIPPHDLYKNGLQRARFLPAIKLIEQYCDVVNVDSGIDYRLRTLEQAEIYHYPLDEQASKNINTYFEQLSFEPRNYQQKIEINHRQLPCLAESDGVVHFNFEQLCQSARSQKDYIELSRIYHTVLLSDVTMMSRDSDDAARRFIAMVDEFYERNVTLIISAEVALESLYSQGSLEFEFKRCQSRLIEMQSHEYLGKDHLP